MSVSSTKINMITCVIPTDNMRETAASALEQHKKYTQQDWQKFMEEHGDAIDEGNLSLQKLCEAQSVDECLVKVGIFSSKAYYDSIPCRLPSQLADGRPPFPITRLICDKKGLDDRVIIQGSDGELILLERLSLFPLWCIKKPYSFIVKHSDIKSSLKKIQREPQVRQLRGEYVRISKIAENIIKSEAVICATLTSIPISGGILDITLGYAGYPSRSEREQAGKRREELLQSIDPKTSFAYELPKQPPVA